MKIPEIFSKCASVIMSKRSDYTTNPDIDNHENFKRSAEIGSWFSDKEDKSYAILIGTKLARLGSLLSSGKKPNNESIDDSFLDLINYCALWMERRSQLVSPTCHQCGIVIIGQLTIREDHPDLKFCSRKCAGHQFY